MILTSGSHRNDPMTSSTWRGKEEPLINIFWIDSFFFGFHFFQIQSMVHVVASVQKKEQINQPNQYSYPISPPNQSVIDCRSEQTETETEWIDATDATRTVLMQHTDYISIFLSFCRFFCSKQKSNRTAFVSEV